MPIDQSFLARDVAAIIGGETYVQKVSPFSRARAEELAADLRKLDVVTFITHSSLSREQRAQTEQAFNLGTNCVIVATSVLELGVDVGDLDHIIQIDAPATVASFLRRMGRTGRRLGTDSNCLFLATNDYALLQAAGIIDLWRSGYVEDVVALPTPYHVLAQQLFALVLQEQDLRIGSLVRRCPVCDHVLAGRDKYCGECGSKT